MLEYVCVPLRTVSTLSHSHSRHVRLVYGETIAKIAVYGHIPISRIPNVSHQKLIQWAATLSQHGELTELHMYVAIAYVRVCRTAS